MILDSDIKHLKATTSRSAHFGFVVMGIPFVFFLIVMGTLSLLRSQKYAQIAGTTLAEIFRDDTAGFDIDTQYPGAYVKALDHYASGLFSIGFSPLVVMFLIFFWKQRGRNIRLLNYIESTRDIEQAGSKGVSP